jgi:signal transduction histidine kinase
MTDNDPQKKQNNAIIFSDSGTQTKQLLERRVAQLALLNNIGKNIAAVMPLEDLFEKVVHEVKKNFGYHHVALFTLDNQQGDLVMRARAGAFAEIFPEVHRINLGRGMVGWVASHGKKILANDVNIEPHYTNFYPDVITQSELSVPIQVGDEVVGVFDIQSPQKNAFDDNDVLVLETLADQVAVAIENARLYESLQQELRERKRAEEEIKQRLVELDEAYNALQENQEKLLISEKMASLGRLSAGIAHEMNTPLAAARAALKKVGLLADEYNLSIDDPDVTEDDHKEIADEIITAVKLADKATERAAGFVRGIKAQTRNLNTFEVQKINVVNVVKDALLLLRHTLERNNCTVDLKYSQNDINILGPPGRLEQVITNLVNNAIDASPPEGGQINIEFNRQNGYLMLRISDNGSGISPENLNKIFDPMFSTKPFGTSTGLGLTIVHEIVTGDFKGSVDVYSELGKGTTFSIQIPLEDGK